MLLSLPYTYIHTFVHAYMHIHTNIHTCIHTYIHTYLADLQLMHSQNAFDDVKKFESNLSQLHGKAYQSLGAAVATIGELTNGEEVYVYCMHACMFACM